MSIICHDLCCAPLPRFREVRAMGSNFFKIFKWHRNPSLFFLLFYIFCFVLFDSIGNHFATFGRDKGRSRTQQSHKRSLHAHTIYKILSTQEGIPCHWLYDKLKICLWCVSFVCYSGCPLQTCTPKKICLRIKSRIEKERRTMDYWWAHRPRRTREPGKRKKIKAKTNSKCNPSSAKAFSNYIDHLPFDVVSSLFASHFGKIFLVFPRILHLIFRFIFGCFGAHHQRNVYPISIPSVQSQLSR